MFTNFLEFVREIYQTEGSVPLHEPKFIGNEKVYLNECIDSTFVSSVGKFVDLLEEKISDYTGSKYAIAICNGTSALHTSLLLANVNPGDEVITQPLTFVATCSAIVYCNAKPVFVDVDRDTMGLSPKGLKSFLEKNAEVKSGKCVNKISGNIIKACIPMHTFGHPCRIDEIASICQEYSIELVEDAAESLGSFYNNQHTGRFGKFGVLSFNGNKIVTAGGGGCIITDDENMARKAKHLTTTAKVPHPWEYSHDMIGFNYRMPNINAALILAQLENLDKFLLEKRKLAEIYKNFFSENDIQFVEEIKNSKSNYWLQTIILENREERDKFLQVTNENGIMTRPIWKLMNKLDMFKECQAESLINSEWLEDRVVNIPSSVR
ncbi:MAG: aminotransferase DegT [Planctomycetota bacterium]|nr:MAG: aminotransferase DegT [Planctomycetota bacterium]